MGSNDGSAYCNSCVPSVMLAGMRTILTTLHSKFIHASLALPCLAAYCDHGCGEILIREFTVHEPRENVLAMLLDENPDVIGFSVYLWNRRATLDLVDALAAARPGLRVVLGGPEVSYEGAGLFRRHPGLSALVRGEGEIPLRGLLEAWQRGGDPIQIPRLALRRGEDDITEGPHGAPLQCLDAIPSPFAGGLTDLTRGFVYYETSRGCPYRCAFCMSALDETVRTYSMARIRSDLSLLMDREVPKIKLVDRTFNYDAQRTREIFSFILEHNRCSHFHFEIGAHLLDEPTLELLQSIPPGMFQFEIGVQSTLPATLSAIARQAPLERLEKNVRRLRAAGNIHLHLDLIAGLPGQNYTSFLDSIDRVSALRPHHLQIEPVKLLPGAPLRTQAAAFGIRHDPNPPYSVLGTPDMSFADLERLRGIGRLLDLSCNSGRLEGFLNGLSTVFGSLSRALDRLDGYWRRHGLYRHPLSQRALFEYLWDFLQQEEDAFRPLLSDLLARDFAHSERVVPGKAPAFFSADLSEGEQKAVRTRVRQETEAIRGQGIKLQHFAATFSHLPGHEGRTLLLFLYFTRTGEGLRVEESVL